MLMVTYILFVVMGLFCILKPEVVAMVDGLRIKSSTNEHYNKQIKLVGIGIVCATTIMLVIELSSYIS